MSVNVLPGEPLDGSGRVCIHLVVRDQSGPITEPHVLHQKVEGGEPVKGQLVAMPTRVRLACDRDRKVAPVTRGGVTEVTPRTDDPRAVSCHKCKRSKDYAEAMEALNRGN